MQVVACKPMASAIAVQVRGGVLLLAWVVCWQLQAGMTGRPRRYRIAVAKMGPSGSGHHQHGWHAGKHRPQPHRSC